MDDTALKPIEARILRRPSIDEGRIDLVGVDNYIQSAAKTLYKTLEGVPSKNIVWPSDICS